MIFVAGIVGGLVTLAVARPICKKLRNWCKGYNETYKKQLIREIDVLERKLDWDGVAYDHIDNISGLEYDVIEQYRANLRYKMRVFLFFKSICQIIQGLALMRGTKVDVSSVMMKYQEQAYDIYTRWSWASVNSLDQPYILSKINDFIVKKTLSGKSWFDFEEIYDGTIVDSVDGTIYMIIQLITNVLKDIHKLTKDESDKSEKDLDRGLSELCPRDQEPAKFNLRLVSNSELEQLLGRNQGESATDQPVSRAD